MSDFFLELYSEEIPHGLQISARNQLKDLILKELTDHNIKFKQFNIYSTPKRLVAYVDQVALEQKIPAQEIKGPKVSCNDQALEGFLRSRSAEKKDLIKKDTDKGGFYFVKLPAKSLLTKDILSQKLPSILKSILCLLDNKVLDFKYHHFTSSNLTYINGPFDDKEQKVKNFKDYNKILEKNKIELDHEKREIKIKNELEKILKKNKCSTEINTSLVAEVTNLVETPVILK